MARRQRAPWQRRILGFLVAVPAVIVGIVVVYTLASFADGSLAHVSGPVEVAILTGVVAVLLLCRWLVTRGGSAGERVGVTDATLSGRGEVSAASWPPGKIAPTTMPATMRTLPAVQSAWGGASAAPAASTAVSNAPTVVPSAAVPSASTVAPSASTVVRTPSASTVVRPPIVVPIAPAATAIDRDPTPDPRPRGTRELRSVREPTPASQGSGATSALAEYLDGRTELTNLIASVEARMPTDPEPGAQLDVVADTESEHYELSVAQSTKMLARAVEQVARACELIAHACELFAERVESDRLERRTLADAVMTLAQQAMPPASTPRLVSARATRPRVIIEDDSPSADRQTSEDLGVRSRSPS